MARSEGHIDVGGPQFWGIVNTDRSISDMGQPLQRMLGGRSDVTWMAGNGYCLVCENGQGGGHEITCHEGNGLCAAAAGRGMATDLEWAGGCRVGGRSIQCSGGRHDKLVRRAIRGRDHR